MVSMKAAAATKLHPISNFQKRLLAAAMHPETKPGFHDHMTLRWAFRIKPSIPLRTLRRAFDKLVNRHDSLRLRFVDRGQGVQAEILPSHPYGIQVVDLSHLTETEQNNEIQGYACSPISAFSDSLFEMTLLQCGKRGDVLLTRAHHAIVDGYSIAIIIEELLKSVLNLPLSRKVPGHADFIKLSLDRVADRSDAKEAYWCDQLLPLPCDPRIGRVSKGLPSMSPQTLGETRRINDILTVEEAQQLEKRVKSTGVTAFALLHAAFCETLCTNSAQDECIVLSVIGRKDAALSSFVGADLQAVFLKFQRNKGCLEESARWVAHKIAEGSEYLPSDTFAPGGRLGSEFVKKQIPVIRFLVHIANPTGYLSNSPFRKLFERGLEGTVSVGFASIERIPLPGRTETDFELELLVSQTNAGPNATIIADAAAFSGEELSNYVQGIKSKLGFT